MILFVRSVPYVAKFMWLKKIEVLFYEMDNQRER